jgi:uncharacterized protein YabN with tetrapyrrole methylase and pyrophosphatase domain
MDLFTEVERQETEAKEFGFYWEHIDQLIDQIQSECKEVKEAFELNDRAHLQEELGDLMQAAISLAVYCNEDPAATLKKSIDKFQKRYDAVVELAQRDGHKTLHGKSFDELMVYWDRAKVLNKK